MSKWLDTEKAKQFMNRLKEDTEEQSGSGEFISSRWTPEKGTADKPKVFELRFIPDPQQLFYKRIFYHMFKVGESWKYSLCPKTHNIDSYCPICSVSSKLFSTGVESDKVEARLYKRKEKFVANILIVDDPRDSEREEDKKVNGTVKLYEFPGKVEQILKQEIQDPKNGRGISIFDPSNEGYNFLLKVAATKPQSDGRAWPDYSMSSFTLKPCSIGTDEEIEEILKKTFDLDKYLNSFNKGDSVIEWLKQNLVFEIIEDEYNRMNGIKKEPVVHHEASTPTEVNEERPEAKEEKKSPSEMSDDDILAELESLTSDK